MERMLRTIWLGDSSRQKEGTFATTAGGLCKVRSETALAGARRTGDQHAAAAEIARAAQHGVEARESGGNAPVETVCCKPSEVTGSTDRPASSIRNGYSFVP